jgi:hypothetical protein
MAAALDAARAAEIGRAINAVIDIAQDRARRPGNAPTEATP